MAVLAVSALLSGCQHGPYASYCDAVKDKRTQLSTTLDAGGNDAFIKALPILEQLRDQSPPDVHDDWQAIVTSISGLRSALAAGHVTASSYDRDHPPKAMTQAQRTAIDVAAQRLNSAATRAALSSVQQEVRDVCGTPLLLV